MLTPRYANRFKRDLNLCRKRGKDMTKLRVLIAKLIREVNIPKEYRDHPLRGKWKDCRDAHIEPDWLLIYRIVGNNLQLVRTGTHADLF